MMDIKIKKAAPKPIVKPVALNVNKVVEKKVEQAETVQTLELPQKKSTYSKFSTILFGFMTTSVICYVFMISSSVFYAVKMSQFTFKAENIASSVSTSSDAYEVISKGNSDRISYINKDSDTSISLK